MFESARLPHAMTKEDFAAYETGLRERLLNAQFELAERKQATVLALINGSDGAGKGAVVNRLYDWLDDHFVETLSYGKPTDEERARPGAWRYWRDMPAKGRIGLVLGSWHHRALRNRALGRINKATYDNVLEEMNRAEEMLRLEGVFLLKIWLYFDEAEARRHLAKQRKMNGALRRPLVLEWEEIDSKKTRARLNNAALEMIEMTSTGDAPWAVVPAQDPQYRDAAIGDLLLQTLTRANADSPPAARARGGGAGDQPAAAQHRHGARSYAARRRRQLRTRLARPPASSDRGDDNCGLQGQGPCAGVRRQ